MNSDKSLILLIIGIIFIIIMYTVQFLFDSGYSNYFVDYSVEKQVDKAYICKDIYIYQYYIDSNTLTDAQNGIQYDLYGDCNESE